MTFGLAVPIVLKGVGNEGRDARDTFNAQGSPLTYNTVNHNYVGLDWNVQNNDVASAVVNVDGLDYTILSGGVENHASEPFTLFILKSGANWNVRLAGLTFDYLRQIKAF